MPTRPEGIATVEKQSKGKFRRTVETKTEFSSALEDKRNRGSITQRK